MLYPLSQPHDPRLEDEVARRALLAAVEPFEELASQLGEELKGVLNGYSGLIGRSPGPPRSP